MNLFVLDTNVVLSGLLAVHTESPSFRVVRAILTRRLRALLSPVLLGEYYLSLVRPDVMRRHRRSPAQVDRFLLDLVSASVVLHPPRARENAPDPGDQHLWDLLAAESDAILVTGDRLLLDSDDFPGRIVSPRTAAERNQL